MCSAAGLVFGIFSDCSWTAFGRLSEGLRSCAVVAQKPLEVALGTPRRGQNRLLDVPKASQERPKSVPRAAKSGQERQRAPKGVLRAFQERTKSAQERPRAAKSAPRERSWRPRRLQEGVLGGYWEDLGGILETFGGCLRAMFELVECI